MDKNGHMIIVTFKRKREWIVDKSSPEQYEATLIRGFPDSTRHKLNNFFPILPSLLIGKNIVQISHPSFVVKNCDVIVPIKYIRFWGLRSTRIIWHDVNVGNQPVNGSPAPGPGTIQLLDIRNRVIQDLSEENQKLLESVAQLGGSVLGNVATTASLRRYRDVNGARQKKNDTSRRSSASSSSEKTLTSDRTDSASLFGQQNVAAENEFMDDFFDRSSGFTTWAPPNQNDANQGSARNMSVPRTFFHEILEETGGCDNFFISESDYTLPDSEVGCVNRDFPQVVSGQSEYHQFPGQGTSGGIRNQVYTPVTANPLGILAPDFGNMNHQLDSPLANLYSMTESNVGPPETEFNSGSQTADCSWELMSNTNRKRPVSDAEPTDPKRPNSSGNPSTGNFIFDTCSRSDPLFNVFDGPQVEQESQIDGWKTAANTKDPPFFGAAVPQNIKVYFEAKKMPELLLVSNYGLPIQQHRRSYDADDGEEDALVLPPDGLLHVKQYLLNAKTGYGKIMRGNRITFSKIDTEFLSNVSFKNGICRMKAKWTGFIIHQGPKIKVGQKFLKAPLEFKGPVKLRGDLVMVTEEYVEEGQQNEPSTSTRRVARGVHNGSSNH
ncbi:unnamed protein product [Caenorhabditis brenneri]